MAPLLLIKPHSLCTLGTQETGQTRPSEGAPGRSRPSLQRICPCPQGTGSQTPWAGPAPRGRRGFHMGSSPPKHPEVGSQAVWVRRTSRGTQSRSVVGRALLMETRWKSEEWGGRGPFLSLATSCGVEQEGVAQELVNGRTRKYKRWFRREVCEIALTVTICWALKMCYTQFLALYVNQCNPFILTATQRGSLDYCPHCTDVEIEAQTG